MQGREPSAIISSCRNHAAFKERRIRDVRRFVLCKPVFTHYFPKTFLKDCSNYSIGAGGPAGGRQPGRLLRRSCAPGLVPVCMSSCAEACLHKSVHSTPSVQVVWNTLKLCVLSVPGALGQGSDQSAIVPLSCFANFCSEHCPQHSGSQAHAVALNCGVTGFLDDRPRSALQSAQCNFGDTPTEQLLWFRRCDSVASIFSE